MKKKSSQLLCFSPKKQQHCHPRRAYCFFFKKQNCSCLRAYCCSSLAGHCLPTAGYHGALSRSQQSKQQRSKPRETALGGAPHRQRSPCLGRGEGLTAHFKLQAVCPKLCTVQYFSGEFIQLCFFSKQRVSPLLEQDTIGPSKVWKAAFGWCSDNW